MCKYDAFLISDTCLSKDIVYSQDKHQSNFLIDMSEA